MNRTLQQSKDDKISSPSVVFHSNEVEPMILKGIIEKNGGKITMKKSLQNENGYTFTFSMKMQMQDSDQGVLQESGHRGTIVQKDVHPSSLSIQVLDIDAGENMLLRSPDKENSVKSERDIGEDVGFAPQFPRSRSMVFKEKNSRALSE